MKKTCFVAWKGQVSKICTQTTKEIRRNVYFLSKHCFGLHFKRQIENRFLVLLPTKNLCSWLVSVFEIERYLFRSSNCFEYADQRVNAQDCVLTTGLFSVFVTKCLCMGRQWT